MDRAEIAATLQGAEAALERGEGLAGTGFWKAVGATKQSPEHREQFGSRIAEIDRRAFEDWALLVVPNPLGTGLALGAFALGVAGVVAAPTVDPPLNAVLFGAGAVALFPSTHGLGHLVAGKAMGMRFTHWFVGTVRRPQPGVKVDYASYLATPARKRAWMHASGALVTKALPLALIPAALRTDLPGWVPWGLAAFAVVQIATDALWSVKASDWKKFKREMRHAG